MKNSVERWLNRGWVINRELSVLKQTQDSLYLRLTSTATPFREDSVSCGRRDPHQFEEYVAFTELVDQKAAELMRTSTEIFHMVWQVRDSKCRDVLLYRYLNFMQWSEIASIMNYSVRRIHQLHAKALASVNALLTNQEHT